MGIAERLDDVRSQYAAILEPGNVDVVLAAAMAQGLQTYLGQSLPARTVRSLTPHLNAWLRNEVTAVADDDPGSSLEAYDTRVFLDALLVHMGVTPRRPLAEALEAASEPRADVRCPICEEDHLPGDHGGDRDD